MYLFYKVLTVCIHFNFLKQCSDTARCRHVRCLGGRKVGEGLLTNDVLLSLELLALTLPRPGSGSRFIPWWTRVATGIVVHLNLKNMAVQRH